MPDHPDQAHYFGGGVSDSNLTPITLVMMAIAILLILSLPRKHAIVPVLVTIFLIPGNQQVYVLGVHWMMSRIVTLAGLARVMIGKKGSLFTGGYNSIDQAFVGSTVCQAIAFILLFRDGSALINQFGFLIDYLGAYILLRALLQDEWDVYRSLKCLAVLTVIMGCAMVREQTKPAKRVRNDGRCAGAPDTRGEDSLRGTIFPFTHGGNLWRHTGSDVPIIVERRQS